MIALGEHAEFIIAAYAGVFIGLGLLIGWIVYDSRRVRARLETFGDKRG